MVLGVLLRRSQHANMEALQLLLDCQPPNLSPDSVDLNAVVRSAFPGGLKGKSLAPKPVCEVGWLWLR